MEKPVLIGGLLGKDMLVCKLCSEYYKDPRILPCGDTFCRKCLQVYYDVRQAEISSRLGGIPCPKCQQLAAIPQIGVAGFPLDLKIRKMKERFMEALADNKSMDGPGGQPGSPAVGQSGSSRVGGTGLGGRKFSQENLADLINEVNYRQNTKESTPTASPYTSPYSTRRTSGSYVSTDNQQNTGSPLPMAGSTPRYERFKKGRPAFAPNSRRADLVARLGRSSSTRRERSPMTIERKPQAYESEFHPYSPESETQTYKEFSGSRPTRLLSRGLGRGRYSGVRSPPDSSSPHSPLSPSSPLSPRSRSPVDPHLAQSSGFSRYSSNVLSPDYAKTKDYSKSETNLRSDTSRFQSPAAQTSNISNQSPTGAAASPDAMKSPGSQNFHSSAGATASPHSDSMGQAHGSTCRRSLDKKDGTKTSHNDPESSQSHRTSTAGDSQTTMDRSQIPSRHQRPEVSRSNTLPAGMRLPAQKDGTGSNKHDNNKSPLSPESAQAKSKVGATVSGSDAQDQKSPNAAKPEAHQTSPLKTPFSGNPFVHRDKAFRRHSAGYAKSPTEIPTNPPKSPQGETLTKAGPGNDAKASSPAAKLSSIGDAKGPCWSLKSSAATANVSGGTTTSTTGIAKSPRGSGSSNSPKDPGPDAKVQSTTSSNATSDATKNTTGSTVKSHVGHSSKTTANHSKIPGVTPKSATGSPKSPGASKKSDIDYLQKSPRNEMKSLTSSTTPSGGFAKAGVAQNAKSPGEATNPSGSAGFHRETKVSATASASNSSNAKGADKATTGTSRTLSSAPWKSTGKSSTVQSKADSKVTLKNAANGSRTRSIFEDHEETRSIKVKVSDDGSGSTKVKVSGDGSNSVPDSVNIPASGTKTEESVNRDNGNKSQDRGRRVRPNNDSSTKAESTERKPLGAMEYARQRIKSHFSGSAPSLSSVVNQPGSKPSMTTLPSHPEEDVTVTSPPTHTGNQQTATSHASAAPARAVDKERAVPVTAGRTQTAGTHVTSPTRTASPASTAGQVDRQQEKFLSSVSTSGQKHQASVKTTVSGSTTTTSTAAANKGSGEKFEKSRAQNTVRQSGSARQQKTATSATAAPPEKSIFREDICPGASEQSRQPQTADDTSPGTSGRRASSSAMPQTKADVHVSLDKGTGSPAGTSPVSSSHTGSRLTPDSKVKPEQDNIHVKHSNMSFTEAGGGTVRGGSVYSSQTAGQAPPASPIINGTVRAEEQDITVKSQQAKQKAGLITGNKVQATHTTGMDSSTSKVASHSTAGKGTTLHGLSATNGVANGDDSADSGVKDEDADVDTSWQNIELHISESDDDLLDKDDKSDNQEDKMEESTLLKDKAQEKDLHATKNEAQSSQNDKNSPSVSSHVKSPPPSPTRRSRTFSETEHDGIGRERRPGKDCGAQVPDNHTGPSLDQADGANAVYRVKERWRDERRDYEMPTSICVLSNGITVTAEYGNGNLHYFDKDGSFMYKTEGIKPFSIAGNDSNQVIVADRKNKTVRVFDEYGYDVTTWDNGKFQWISGLALTSQGNYVIYDREKYKVGIYTPSGDRIQEFGSYGDRDTQLCMADFLAVDSHDRIICCDSGNHCIKIFDSDGKLITKFGERGNGEGQLEWPKGICCDAKDNIIVTDHRNRRISLFSPDGQFIQHLLQDWPNPYSVCFCQPNLLGVTHYSLTGFSLLGLYELTDLEPHAAPTSDPAVTATENPGTANETAQS